LKVVAIYQRVAAALMQQFLNDFISLADTVPPTDEQQKRFRSTLGRLKQQLQETDTAYFWVTKAPYIARIRTASQIRDSIAQVKEDEKARAELQRLFAQASFTGFKVSIYPDRYPLDGGGSITAIIDPGTAGWYRRPDKSVMEVQCEGLNGGRITRENSYILSNIGLHEREKALCLWSGDAAREFNDIQPSTFRMRLIGKLGAFLQDTVFGPWVNIPASAVR
jgi:hypothetical protein